LGRLLITCPGEKGGSAKFRGKSNLSLDKDKRDFPFRDGANGKRGAKPIRTGARA